MTHDELIAALEGHIARDAEEHAASLAALDAHAEANPDEQDHAALRMLLLAHVERTESGHARLLAAYTRHAEAIE